MKIVWYEDMIKDMIKSIREVASFTGYHLTELKVLQLDDLLYIDNFRKAMVNSKEGDKEGQEHTKKFIRKGRKISKTFFCFGSNSPKKNCSGFRKVIWNISFGDLKNVMHFLKKNTTFM